MNGGPPLDEVVDDVEQLGDLLDLVDDHHRRVRTAGDDLAQPFRPGRIEPVDLGGQEVDPQRDGRGAAGRGASGGVDLGLRRTAASCCARWQPSSSPR